MQDFILSTSRGLNHFGVLRSYLDPDDTLGIQWFYSQIYTFRSHMEIQFASEAD